MIQDVYWTLGLLICYEIDRTVLVEFGVLPLGNSMTLVTMPLLYG